MPISPSEVVEQKAEHIPDEVFAVWDRMIAANWKNHCSVVMQSDIVEALIPLTGHHTRIEVFDKGWLDIEDIYRAVGWNVTYDKPAYNESYPASFTFRKN